jgi:hypothetical protein
MFEFREQDIVEKRCLIWQCSTFFVFAYEEEYSQSDFLAHSSFFPCQLMEEDYEEAKQMVLRRHIAIHSLVSPCSTSVSRLKKEQYKKHCKNVSK